MHFLRKAHGHAKRHYEKHYKARYQERAHLVFLLDGILVAIAFGLLGLGAYFRWFYHPLRDDFKLSVLSEQTITAGKETTFSVRVVNSGVTDLRDAELVVHLPPSFLASDMPAGYGKDGIEIGDMPAHASNEYHFRGTFLGTETSAEVYAHFTARNDQDSSDEKLTKKTLHWESNAIELRFEAPEAIVPGQSMVFGLHVKNGSALTFENAAITPAWPAGFRLQNATPPVYRGAIALGRLDAGEEAVVKFSGRFNGAVDLLRLAATLHASLNGQGYDLAKTQSAIRMATVDLKLEAAFPEGLPAFVRPGQEVPVVIRYRNEGDRPIRDLALAIVPEVNTLGTVRWDTSNRIEALAAGGSGERKAFVRVQESISRYVVNPLFRAVPRATFSIDDPKIVDAQVDGKPVETKIAGSARLRAVARYYTNEGDQLGRGPLPPRVGKATTYWIFASLESGATEIRDGVATFRLPGNVTWTGRSAVTAGQELALEGDRLLWHLGTIDPHAGVLHEAPSASFEVSLTPTASQAGTAPLLLADAAYTGLDAWTEEALSSAQGGLTTQLSGDSAVAGRSVVKP